MVYVKHNSIRLEIAMSSAPDDLEKVDRSGQDESSLNMSLTRKQAAEYLNVSTRTLDRWRSDGLIGHDEIGSSGNKVIRFNTEELDQLKTRKDARPEPRKSGWLSRFRRASG
jgi:excisionase family DNA binding protein